MSAQAALPDTFTVGDRTYRIIKVFTQAQPKVNFTLVMIDMLIVAGNSHNASMSVEHATYLVTNEGDIPPELRKLIRFIFPETKDRDGRIQMVQYDRSYRQWRKYRTHYRPEPNDYFVCQENQP